MKLLVLAAFCACCFSQDTVLSYRGTFQNSLNMVRSIALSPDGLNLYAASYGYNALVWFQRDPETGSLVKRGALSDGVGGVDGLWYASSVTVSPEGLHVYATGHGDDAVSWFSRDTLDGGLTYGGIFKGGSYGAGVLSGAKQVAISPDGKHAYVIALYENGISYFSRNQATGELSYGGVLRDGVDGVDGLDHPFSLVISPDGNNVYVCAGADADGTNGDNALSGFSRNPGNGKLTFQAVLKDGVDGVDGLANARALAISPDGGRLYAAALTDNAVSWFIRNSADGSVSYGGCLKNDSGRVEGLLAANTVSVSQDGKRVFVGGLGGSVASFVPDSAQNGLIFEEARFNGRDGVSGLSEVFCLAVSGDDRNLYAAASGDNAVSWFRLPETASKAEKQPLVASGIRISIAPNPVAAGTPVRIFSSRTISDAAVFNVNGSTVAGLLFNRGMAGFDTRSLAPGVYILRVQSTARACFTRFTVVE